MIFPRTVKKIPLYLQSNSSECGISCILMMLEYFGIRESAVTLRRKLPTVEHGISVKTIIDLLKCYGLHPSLYKVHSRDHESIKLPSILHWDNNHFVVMTGYDVTGVYINDPAKGALKVTYDCFSERFTSFVIEIDPINRDFAHHPSKRIFTIRELIGRSEGLYAGLTLIFFYGMLMQVLNILSPMVLQVAIDKGITLEETPLITVALLLLTFLLALQLITTYIRDKISQHLSFQVSKQLSNNVFRYLIRLPMRFFIGRSSADLLSRFKSFENVRRFITSGAITLTMDALLVFCLLIVMFIYSPFLGAISLAFSALYFGWRCTCHRHMRLADEARIVASAKESGYFLEAVGSIASQKSLSLEQTKDSAWCNIVETSINCQIEYNNWQIRNRTINQLLMGVDNLLTFYFAALFISSGSFTIGMFFAYTAFKVRYSTSIERLVDSFFDLRLLETHLSRLSEITTTDAEFSLDYPSPRDTHSHYVAETSLGSNVHRILTVAEGSFRFGTDSSPTFSNLSFDVHEGERIVITGPSGAGKSTLMKCILGLLPLEAGIVTFRGKNVQSVRDISWDAGILLQDDELLDGTIMENVTAFSNNPNAEMAIWACEKACVLNDVRALPFGFSTPVGFQGKTLSCGQRQRIMLARALYRKPRVLFLDESFSNLNLELEEAIDANLRQLDLTIVAVSHRETAIKSADRVVRL